MNRIAKIRSCIGLLDSIILSKEDHTMRSKKLVEDTLRMLEDMEREDHDFSDAYEEISLPYDLSNSKHPAAKMKDWQL